MRKAFAYLRVSGSGQAGTDRDGFPRQLAAIEKYATANGISIVQVFKEAGVSGKLDIEHRPALKDMNASFNGVNLVLIEKLDRLSRYLMIQESILEDLNQRGVELISVSEPDLCSDDPTRTLMRQVLGAFFQYERTMTITKLNSARTRLRNTCAICKEPKGQCQGHQFVKTNCEGAKPYGHSSKPAEAAVVQRISTLKSEGKTLRSIADCLNSEGLKPRSAEFWHASTISNVLKRIA